MLDVCPAAERQPTPEDKSCLPFCSCGTCHFCLRRSSVLRVINREGLLVQAVKRAWRRGDYLPTEIRSVLDELEAAERAVVL